MADNIDKKIDKIEKSCYELARKELKELKEENNINSEQIISEKIENYKQELSKKYEYELSKIIREYNRNIFDFEMGEKVKINNFKSSLIEKLTKKIINKFQDFIQSDEYRTYLFSNLENLLGKFNSKSIIYLTDNDYYKFNNDIQNKFETIVKKMDNENIGGFIVINENEKISIDNTIKTNIAECIKNINL